MYLLINNFADMLNVIINGWFGFDYTLLAIVCVMIVAGMAYAFRLPFTLNLVIAWSLIYMFDLMSGGTSYFLQMIWVLLSIGLAVLIIRGVLGYAKEWSQ